MDGVGVGMRGGSCLGWSNATTTDETSQSQKAHEIHCSKESEKKEWFSQQARLGIMLSASVCCRDQMPVRRTR